MTTPDLASPATQYTVREESINSILGVIRADDISRTKPVEEARKQLATYSDSTIALIVKSTRNPNRRVGLMTTVINKTDERTVREVLSLHVHCPSRVAPPNAKHHDLIGIIRGLHQIERFKDHKLEELTGDELKVAIAFMNITSAAHRSFDNSSLCVANPHDLATATIHISNTTVQKLITDHHHRMDDLIAFLYQGRPDLAQSAFSGLPHLRWYKNQSIAGVTEEIIDIAISYLRLTDALQTYSKYEHLALGGSAQRPAAYIDNPALEDIIDQHLRQVENIIELIKERGTADIGMIRDYLDDDTALKNGTL